MIHVFMITACALALVSAIVPNRRWFYADVFLLVLVQAGFVAAILIELNSTTADGSLDAILLPILPVIPAILFAAAMSFRFTAYLIRNVHFKRTHHESAR